jgi:conjugal transfer pilin signal peptidase TrbI
MRRWRWRSWTRREAWVLRVSLLLAGLLLALGPVVATRFRLGIGLQRAVCLPPYRLFLIDRRTRPRRGDYVAFRADDRLQPYFRPGTLVIKELAGVAGDRVVVATTITINGQVVAPPAPGLGITPLVGALGKTPAALQFDAILPAGAGWTLGHTWDSFDSRYWGYVYDDQIIGRAYALW